jgi:hypothetical protein
MYNMVIIFCQPSMYLYIYPYINNVNKTEKYSKILISYLYTENLDNLPDF